MRIRPFLPLIVIILAAAIAAFFVPWEPVFFWAGDVQRVFQDTMARGLMAVRAGDVAAIWMLCAATAAYGFVHALGPGHGKILLGGAAMASGATLNRMAVVTLLSSLAQSGSAIALVGLCAAVLGLSANALGPIADTYLAPASYVAIASLGVYLIRRGARQIHRISKVHEHHDGPCSTCGHAHGPSVKEVEALSSLRETLFLISSIAIRPCTGAIFVLVIALRFEVFWIGCLAVLTMGLGTAAFNLIVAISGVTARRLSRFGAKNGDSLAKVSASAQIFGGVLIAGLSLMWLLRFGL